MLSDFDYVKTEAVKKREVFNIKDAIAFIDSKISKGAVSKDIFLQLHELVMKDLNDESGHFRKVSSAIFNQANVAVYLAPPPSQIDPLINKLIDWVNSNPEEFPLINALIAHLIFEKIHPFLDGNGRVGRLLIAAVLKLKGWDFNFAVPFEEYLDQNKDAYYFHLDQGLKFTNDYLIFMLTAFLQGIEQIRKQIGEELAKKDGPFLPPRQDEIYQIIKEHTTVSFDMIRRRFLKVPERTLRYDLKKLTDKNLIETTGQTRGRYYRPKNLLS